MLTIVLCLFNFAEKPRHKTKFLKEIILGLQLLAVFDRGQKDSTRNPFDKTMGRCFYIFIFHLPSALTRHKFQNSRFSEEEFGSILPAVSRIEPGTAGWKTQRMCHSPDKEVLTSTCRPFHVQSFSFFCNKTQRLHYVMYASQMAGVEFFPLYQYFNCTAMNHVWFLLPQPRHT